MSVLTEIQSIEVGRRTADSSTFLLHVDAGKPIELVYRFWLLHRSDGVIVVDTGIDRQEALRRGVPDPLDTTGALAACGLAPEDIRTVILTHLHWDHASAIQTFPNAEVYLQRDEADFFGDPLRSHSSIDRYYSHHPVLRRLLGSSRVRLVDGAAQIAPGIGVIPLPGHTPGHQGVTVQTAAGCEIIVADAAPFNRNYLQDLPNGILHDLGASIASLSLARAKAPVAVHTGHDPVSRLHLAGSF